MLPLLKTANNSFGEDVENWDPFALLVGMQNGAAATKSSTEFLQK